MKNKIIETDWENVIDAEIDINSGKSESNQTLSSLRIVTSLVGMHVFAILRNVLVKFEHAELISISASITFSQSQPKKNLKHKETNLIT
jgi:hypothetical protein